MQKLEEERLQAEKEAQENLQQKKGKKGGKKKDQAEENDEDEFEEPYVDKKEEWKKLYLELDVTVDPEGIQCVMPKPLFEHDFIKDFMVSLRDGIFQYLKSISDDIKRDEVKHDKEFIENSLLILDERLRDHWPMKGRLEVEIFQVRSAEITQHKRRYERHIRSVIDEADLQTEQFNLLLERSMEAQANYERDQKNCVEELPKANSLSKL